MIKLKELLKEIDAAPAIVQATNEFSPDFIGYMKSVENAAKQGYQKNKWYPHISPEGGNQTIAYGHKLKDNEVTQYANGISDSEAERLLKTDLELARKTAYANIKAMFNVQLLLDKSQEEMLVDYVFNLGSLKQFPKFTRAVLNKDWKTAAKEYKRTFKSKSGDRLELARNKIFFDRYLKPLLAGSVKNEGITQYDYDGDIKKLEAEWDRLDTSGQHNQQQEIAKQIAKLRAQKEKWEKMYRPTL